MSSEVSVYDVTFFKIKIHFYRMFVVSPFYAVQIPAVQSLFSCPPSYFAFVYVSVCVGEFVYVTV